MTIADERILEFLCENESGTPTEMSQSDYVRFGRVHIHRRSKKLENYGLVRHLGNGVFILTDEGEKYLEGELDAEKLEPDEE